MKPRIPFGVSGLLSLLLMLPLLLAACGGGDDNASATATFVQAGPAPEFSGTTIDGRQVSLSGFAGKPTILIFWASW